MRMLRAGVLHEHGQEADAEFAAMLADKLAAAPLKGGGALFQNIQHGGRQSLTGGAQTLLSKPSVRAALAAKARALLLSIPSQALLVLKKLFCWTQTTAGHGERGKVETVAEGSRKGSGRPYATLLALCISGYSRA